MAVEMRRSLLQERLVALPVVCCVEAREALGLIYGCEQSGSTLVLGTKVGRLGEGRMTILGRET